LKAALHGKKNQHGVEMEAATLPSLPQTELYSWTWRAVRTSIGPRDEKFDGFDSTAYVGDEKMAAKVILEL
jgi:hypothetical protein